MTNLKIGTWIFDPAHKLSVPRPYEVLLIKYSTTKSGKWQNSIFSYFWVDINIEGLKNGNNTSKLGYRPIFIKIYDIEFWPLTTQTANFQVGGEHSVWGRGQKFIFLSSSWSKVCNILLRGHGLTNFSKFRPAYCTVHQ